MHLMVLLICLLLKKLFFGDFSNIYQFSTKNGMNWVTYIGIIQEVFDKIFQSFVWRRKINVQSGMLSFASIPVTLRTLFRKNRGKVGSRPPKAVTG